MALKPRHASVLAVLSSALSATAFAVPSIDSEVGIYTDPLSDNLGLTSLSGAAIDAGVVVLDGAPTGVLVTKDINPAALSAWGHVFVKGTGAIAAEVFANGAWSNLALEPFAADGYTHRASLATAAAHKPIRIRLTFSANGPLAPGVDALKATWSPKATVQLGAQHPGPTLCSGASASWRFPISVSNVSATGTVAWVELPAGALSPDFGQDARLRFVSATHGGQVNTTGAPLDVHGVAVPAGAVYWNLGTVRYGSSFPLGVTAQVPQGTLDGTSYTLTVRAQAQNSGASITATAAPTLASATTALRVEKTLSGVYPIGGEPRAEIGSTIGYRLTVTNQYSPTCRATARNLVLWDPLAVSTAPGGLAPYGAAPTLGAGLAQTGGGTTVFGPGPRQTGVTLPGNTAYALIPSLAPGESKTFDIAVPLSTNPGLAGERLTNVAWLDSGYLPHAGLVQASATFRFGIDYTPFGHYAKGENIRGSAAVSAGNDNAHLQVGYGEYFKYLLSVSNLGASVLDTTTLFDKLPTDDLDFVDAWAPAGATIYYHAGGATNAEDQPPDYDFATGALTGAWSTTPVTPVRWVAVRVPRVGSSVIPTNNAGAPLSVTAEIGVRVKQATAACTAKTLRNPGFFHTAYYRDGANTRHAWTNTGTVNAEHTQVVVRVPSFATAWATVSPHERHGAGPLDYTVAFTNSLPGAANLTDTATNVVVRIDMPTASIGGEVRPLDLVDVTAGGVIDDSGLPEYFEVAYPDIAPGGQVTIQVKADAPRGVVDGGTATLRATIRYADVAPGACPVAPNTTQATATFRVDPYLQIDKRVNFAVAGRGSALTHTLRFVNTGEGAARDTVVFDALPRNATFVSAERPRFSGQIWFSAADVPTMPQDVRAPGEWTKSFVQTSGLFVRGIETDDSVTSPVPNPRWVAILADDTKLDPPQLPAYGAPREVVFHSIVPANAPIDGLIVNEANIAARGLLPAVSNLVQTLISDDPALAIAGQCVDIVAAGERFTLAYTFTNDSTNEDTSASAAIRLPAGVTPVSLTLTAGDTYTATLPHDAVHRVTTADGTVTWNITDFLAGPLASGASVAMALTVQVGAVENGAQLPFFVSGTAQNGAGTVHVGTQCVALVENPDLRIVKLASQGEAVAGDAVQYTLVVSNLGRRAVENAILRESLPAHLSIVPGSFSVSPAGWRIGAPHATGQTDPANGGAIYEWSLAHDNAIAGPNLEPGAIPGLAGPLYIRFRALVGAAPAGSTLDNCASVAMGPEADGDQLIEPTDNNRACVPLVIPRADPRITKRGPRVVLDGVTFDYTLTWSNGTRQAATDVVLYERLPDVNGSGATGLKLIGVDAPAGVTVYYSAAPWNAMGAAPSLALGAPTWTTDRTALDTVGWVAFHIPTLPGLAVGDARVRVESTHPQTHAALPAGSIFENCAVITAAGEDANPDNNLSCVTTQIEGLNVAITKTCDPSGFLPGGRPGDTATFTLTVENRGTTAAFGLEVTDVLPSWFSLASIEPTFAIATANGPAAFAAPSLDPRTDTIPWTREGDTFFLGSRDPASPLHYRQVGLFPGHRTTLTFTGTIDLDAAAGLLATNAATVVSARVVDTDPAEKADVLFDNSSSCAFTVQRPDPMVEKTAFAVGGLAQKGGTVTYQIAFDNLGLAAADDVIVQDEIPAGVDFIVGSLGEVPGDAVLELYGPEGWGYQPTVAEGQPDPLVTAWRLRFDSFPAPLDGRFVQANAAHFELGAHSGTRWDPELGAVVAEPGWPTPTFTSPLIPTTGAHVIEWLGMFARGTESGLPVPKIEVLDQYGTTLFEAALDEGGSRALSDIDAGVHPFIQLRAVFVPVTGGADRYGPVTYLEAPYKTPLNGEVWNVHGDTLAAGVAYKRGNGGRGDGGGRGPSGPLVVWENDGFEWGTVDLQDPNIGQVAKILHLGDGMVIASGYGAQNNSTLIVAWEERAGVWQSQALDATDPYIELDYSTGPAVELTGPAADLCMGASPCVAVPLVGYDDHDWVSTLHMWIRRPGGWELERLYNEVFANSWGCKVTMNRVGYVLVDCGTFPYTVMRPEPALGTWVEVELPTDGLLSSYSLTSIYLSDTSPDIFATNASYSGIWRSQLVHFSESTPDSWDLTLLASANAHTSVAMNLTGGGPLGRFVVYMNGAATVWGPGAAGYTSHALPDSRAPSHFEHLAIGGDGTIIGTRSPYVGAPTQNKSRVIWRPTGPDLSDYTEHIAPDHYQYWLPQSRVADSGLAYQYDDYGSGTYVPLEAYAHVPGGIATYYTVPTDSRQWSKITDASGATLGGALDQSGSYPAAYHPVVWSSTDVSGLVMNHTKLPTPEVVNGRILAGTADGCLFGEVDTADGEKRAFSWALVDGVWAPTELTELNGYSQLEYAVTTAEQRIFANAVDAAGNGVAVELVCVTGAWFATPLPIDGFATSRVLDDKNGLLVGTVDGGTTGNQPRFGINAFWHADAQGNTRFLYRAELDGNLPFAGIGTRGLLPRAEHGLVYGNGESDDASTHQAFVWEPALGSGVDDFHMVALPAPVGASSTFVVDFDGENRLLGHYTDDLGQHTVLWRRTDPSAPWTLDPADIAPGRAAVQFLGMGGQAPAIASDTSGNHYLSHNGFADEQAIAWSPMYGLDPRDALTTPAWVRNAYDAGLAPGTFDSERLVLTQTADGFGTFPVGYEVSYVGFIAPNIVLVSDAYYGQGLGVARIDAAHADGTLVYFDYADFDPYTFAYTNPYQLGPIGADGAFTLWGEVGSYYQAYAFVPDAQRPTGYRTVVMPYGGEGYNDEQFYGLMPDDWFSYQKPVPAGTPLGNGCWTFAERTFVSQFDVYDGYPYPSSFTNNRLGSGLEASNLRLWGCPLEADPAAEALSRWGVTYRSDERPSVSFQVRVEDVCQRTIENTATISTSTPQLSTANDTASVTTPVQNADVSLSLTASQTVIGVTGDRRVTLTGTITNAGPHAADDVFAAIALPAGMTLVSGNTSATLGTMAPHTSRTLTFVAQVGEAPNTTYLVAGSVQTSTIDCTDNGDATLSLLSGSYPDIHVEKSGPATVQLGVPFTWQVSWGNIGNTTSGPFTVTDTLPAGVGAVTTGHGTVGPAQVTWAGQDLAPGASVSDTITAVVTDCAYVGQTLVNTLAAPLAGDANPNDNTDGHTTLVLGPAAAVEVALVQSQAHVRPGETVFYTAHFRSSGTAVARGTTLEVASPQPLPGSLVGATWSAGKVVFPLPELAPGQTGSFTFPVVIVEGVTVTAQIVGGNTCGSATSSVTTGLTTGLAIFKTADRNTACNGDVVTWSIIVSNPSAAPHRDVVVSDTVPAGTTLVLASALGATQPDGSLRWALGELAPGAHRVLTFQTIVPASAGALVANTASVASHAGVTTSNTAALRVDCAAPLVATKALALTCEVPARLTVTLGYANRGALPLTGVVLEDPYAHLDPAAVQAGDGVDTGDAVRFALGTLAAGASGQRTYVLTLDQLADGQILTDRATLTADGQPMQTSNQAGQPVRRCDDGDPCTTNVCTPDGCAYLPIPNCAGCQSDTECDDGNACTDDLCIEGECDHVADDTNACAGDDLCQTWQCQAGTCVGAAIDCDDGATCTSDACVAGDCVHTTVVGACGDSECTAAFCAPGTPGSDPTSGCVIAVDDTLCDDGNPCTTDTCDAATGLCVHRANVGLACDDGFACTVLDTCDESGVCVGGDPDHDRCGGLSGADPCRAGVCDPGSPDADAAGCVVDHAPMGTVVQSDIPCGEAACAVGTGDLICDGQGGQVSTCDPAYQGVSDIGDDHCLETQLVVYALVTDPQSGALRGSVRCVSSNGSLTCETDGVDPRTGLPRLKVFEELLCPGTPPIIASP